MTPAILQTFSEYLPRNAAPQEILRWLESSCHTSRRLLVACSGGADSVALACWLKVHFPAAHLQLAHVHHGLRGEHADLDAQSVAFLAEQLQIDHLVRFAKAPAAASEAGLRDLRMGLLADMAASFQADAIAFGHHADDVLENLLFRLARGSSLSGLSGMRALQAFTDQPCHLRPLIRLPASRIRTALQTAGIAWREDASNAAPTYDRNRLRHELLPVFENIFPQRDLRNAAAGIHRQLGEVDALLETLSGQWLDLHLQADGTLPREPLSAAHPAVQRRILERWARRFLFSSLSRTLLESLLEHLTLSTNGEWTVSPEASVVLDASILRISYAAPIPAYQPLSAPFSLQPPDSRPCPDGSVLAAEWVTPRDAALSRALQRRADPTCEACLDCPDSDLPLLIRHWQPGDRFQPLGSPGLRKLQDWFTDRGIPSSARRQLPVVCSKQGEILWVPGLAPAQTRRLTSETVRALRLTYRTP